MESLGAWFERLILDLPRPVVITAIGSGGKTSLIWLLARCLGPGRKVLVTPTTKMFHASHGNGDGRFDRFCDGAPETPEAGVTLAGCFNAEFGKLESLPLRELERAAGGYDLVLIEGDGSRKLPLKGWTDYEPVVPSFTTITVGILPLWPVGQAVSEAIIHRLPRFCAVSGAAPGEAITLPHLAALISGCRSGVGPTERSLFTEGRGRNILFLNQIENDADLVQAQDLAGLLPPDFRTGLAAIIAGSVQRDQILRVHPCNPRSFHRNSRFFPGGNYR